MGEVPKVARLAVAVLLVPQRVMGGVALARKVRGSRQAEHRPKLRIDAQTKQRRNQCRAMRTVIVTATESMQTTIAGIALLLMLRIRALQAVEAPMARQLRVRGVKAQAGSDRCQRSPRAAVLCGRRFVKRFVLLASDTFRVFVFRLERCVLFQQSPLHGRRQSIKLRFSSLDYRRRSSRLINPGL